MVSNTIKSIICPHCKAPTKVINTRSRELGTRIYRRRKCTQCNARFTTSELIIEEEALSKAQLRATDLMNNRKPGKWVITFQRDATPGTQNDDLEIRIHLANELYVEYANEVKNNWSRDLKRILKNGTSKTELSSFLEKLDNFKFTEV